MIKLKFTERDTEYYNEWFSFYPKKDNRGFCLSFSPWGYFDPRPYIHTYLSSLLTIVGFIILGFSWWSLLLIPTLFFSWGQMFIKLPWNSKKDQCDSPTYGIDFYSVDGEFPNHIWITLGKKSKNIYFPWAYHFWKKEILLYSGWYTEQKGDDTWDRDKWGSRIKSETYPYTYTLKSGTVQNVNATVHQTKRYWRRWFKLDTMCRHTLEVEFDSEVGERSGSWKGGVTGCGYDMKKGETSLECLRRMERERSFR